MKNEVILASMCGAVLGKFILTVERNPVDPDYSKKVTENKLRTSSPIYLYSIKPVKVEMAKIVESANGGKFVEYNGDASLRIPLITNEPVEKVIPKPNADSVRNALIKYETSKTPTIFIDYPQLVKEVKALNRESQEILDKFVNELIKYSKTLQDANNIEEASCKNAMEAEGVDVSSLF